MPWRRRWWNEERLEKRKKSSKSSGWRNSSSWRLPNIPGLDILENSILNVDALVGDDPMIDDDLDDSPDNQKLLGSIKGNIVGIQYYDGTVNNYEMVGLVREPDNPYDRNAVRVDNVRKQKVGHLKRQLAAGIAYIMDNKLARVEGIVPSGKNNQYTIPVNITLWGKPQTQNAVASALTRYNIPFQYPGGQMSTVASTSIMSSGYQPRSSSYAPQLLTQAEMKNELDSIFDSMKEHDKTSCMEPAKAIITKLYPHQKRALQWMVNQENSNHLPPLWQERKGKFINIATNFITTERPPSIHGGILADDMGLGKTLEVIALIMTNFCNGKPLAVPVEDIRNKDADMSKQSKNCQVDSVFEKPVLDVKKEVKMETKVETQVMVKKEGKMENVKEEKDDDVKAGEKKKRAPRKRKAAKDKKKKVDVLTEVVNISNSTGASGSPVKRRPKRTIRKPAKYSYSDEEFMLNDVLSPKKQARTSKLSKSVHEENLNTKAARADDDDDEWTPSVDEELGVASNHSDDDVSTNIEEDAPPLSSLITEETSVLSTFIATKHTLNGNSSSDANKDLPALPSLTAEQTLMTDLSCSSVDAVSSSDVPRISKQPSDDAVLISDDDDLPDIQVSENTATRINTRVSTANPVDVSNIGDDLPPLPSFPSTNGASVLKMSSASSTTGVTFASAVSTLPTVLKPAPIDECCVSDLSCASVDVITSSDIPNISKRTSKPIVLSDDDDDEDDDDDDLDLPDIQLSHKAPSRTYTRGPRPTLIVCPLSVMSNWLQQLKEHVHPHVYIRVYLYYGQDRVRDPKVLMSKDIVITTYHTLGMDYKAKQEKGVLHTTHWLRIVLDEGHMIRNPSTLLSKAAVALTSERRWILTGTPIQNSMRDLWSLTVFLKLEPFCSDRQWWKRVIARPIAEGNKKALGRVQALMRAIALRRTKTQKIDGKPLVELPERNVYVQSVELSEEERKVYEAMATEGRLAIGRYFRAGTLLHHYGDILSILLRLRQLCCHPGLCNKARAKAEIEALIGMGNNEAEELNVVTDEAKKKLVEKLLNVLSQGADEECCVCLESLRLPVITACAHVFCKQCIQEVIRKDQENASCPLCRANVKDKELVEVPEDKIEPPKPVSGPWQSSAKVDAMMQHLIQLQRDEPTVKSLVVSQFTSLLDLVQKPLSDVGIKFVSFDGRMSMKKRSEALEEFAKQGPDTPTVCLLSLKAGGVGVNLVAASRVFLLDPAWNPASEEQCFDRCHRLGQNRDVIITKFIVKDSVEERMMDLQEKKRNLMVGAFGKKQTAEERQRTRINDIKLLMDL